MQYRMLPLKIPCLYHTILFALVYIYWNYWICFGKTICCLVSLVNCSDRAETHMHIHISSSLLTISPVYAKCLSINIIIYISKSKFLVILTKNKKFLYFVFFFIFYTYIWYFKQIKSENLKIKISTKHCMV